MSLKYKSPLIRSRNTSATKDNTSQIVESPSQQETNSSTDSKINDVLVYDNTPQSPAVAQNWRGRGCSSPRFNSPRLPRGSPYQWTPPNRFNNSWNSDQSNNSGGYTPREQNSYSTHRPAFNKYKKQNINNYSSRNSESGDENYFHPSMLEDPWAQLLNNSLNNPE